MSITAEATNAPATTWCARSGETPGRLLISATFMSASLGSHSSSSEAGSSRRTNRPSSDGAAPQIRDNERRRHYESEVLIYFENRPIVGVERLYRRTILLEPTTVCAAHCRWCLRGQYPVKTMSEDDHKRQSDLVQKATDQAIADVDHALAAKEKEIMTV